MAPVRIHFVRHGKAAAGWDGHPDPGLDPLGQTQARLVADRLAALDPMDLVSSPLARARETAEPLAAIWDREVHIEPRVAEIPSPSEDLAERSRWLQDAMGRSWADLGAPWTDWRDALVAWLLGLERDTVIFSHFIAINAALGHAEGNDALVCFRPDNCSVTTFVVDGAEDRRLVVETRGDEAVTHVG
jgi:broad specificity phosphatase PhoE